MSAISGFDSTELGNFNPLNATVPLLQVSQAHLQVFDTCKRKFQYLYIDQIGSPLSSEEQARLQQGSRFHLLLQQRELGLAVESLASEHAPLDVWLDRFLTAEPTIVGDPQTPPLQRQSEHLRSLILDAFLLVAIYDLFVAYPDHAQILDWKTYPRPHRVQRLTESWQTRLYLYLLAETSSYSPDQLSMTYWFFQSAAQAEQPNQPPSPSELERPAQFIRVDYSTALHQQTHQDLQERLQLLHTYLEAYATGESFPQEPEDSPLCPTCTFAVHCQRSPLSQQSPLAQLRSLSFDQIPEVPLSRVIQVTPES